MELSLYTTPFFSWFPWMLSSVSSIQQNSWVLPMFSLPVLQPGNFPCSRKSLWAIIKFILFISHLPVIIVLRCLMSNVLSTIALYILFRFFQLSQWEGKSSCYYSVLIRNISPCRTDYNHFNTNSHGAKPCDRIRR